MTNVVHLHPEAHGAPDLGAKLRRAEALRRAVLAKARFSLEDQLRTARNLHRLLTEWRGSKRFDLDRFLDVAGLGGNGLTDSTKRLDTYTLPEDAPRARRNRIAKKPSKYLAIACAAAAELEEPEEVMLCRIFEGCSFGTDQDVDEDWETGSWEILADLLSRMAAAIVRDRDLKGYWRKVRSMNGRYDVRKGVIRADADCLDYVVEGYGYAGAVICSDEIAPLPSVPLGRRREGPAVPGEIRLLDGRKLGVDFTFWLEARLALGPVHATDSVGPMIELRTVLEGATADGQAVVLGNPFTDMSDRIETVSVDGNVLKIDSIVLSDYELVPEAEYRQGGDHSYFAWEEVSPALLRRLLVPDDLERTGPFLAIDRNSGIWVEERPPSRYGRGSAAAVLHTDLLTGRLEQALVQVCDDLVDRLEALRGAEGRRIREAEAAALTRWARRGTMNSHSSEEDE